MMRVGLTGGIASGKTTVSNIFQSLGVEVIDTDSISHNLMQPGQIAYQKSLDHFGHQILASDASLNRVLLREIVFNDEQQKAWLENMLHPLIRESSDLMMQKVGKGDYVMLVVPLMFETGFNELVDHVIAIDCPKTDQISRLTARDGIGISLAHKMLDAQMSNAKRLALADSSINNPDNSDPTQQINALHQKLIELGKKYRH